MATIPLITTPFAESFPKALLNGAREIIRPTLTCPEGKQEFDRACFPPAMLACLPASLPMSISIRAPATRSWCFPIRTLSGSCRVARVAGGVVQGYLVNGDYLTEVHLAGLRKANPPFGLYLPDGINSFGMDGVPSFTRSPGLWFYLLRHYRRRQSHAEEWWDWCWTTTAISIWPLPKRRLPTQWARSGSQNARPR